MNPRWLLLIVAGGLIAWWMLGDQNSWRYRMTVEVQTPEGVRSGSAVRKVTFRRRRGFFLVEGSPSWDVKGQAVVVDLPNGKRLYALMRSGENREYGARIADDVLGDGRRVLGWPRPAELYPNASKKTVGYRLKSGAGLVPMLVTFGNSTDPMSVQLVDPHNLEPVFGPGYELKRITIDVVERPVTTGIKSRLPWLTDTEARRLDPNFKASANPSLPQKLWHGDFWAR